MNDLRNTCSFSVKKMCESNVNEVRDKKLGSDSECGGRKGLLFCKIQRQQSVLSVVLEGLTIILSAVLLKIYRLTQKKNISFALPNTLLKHMPKEVHLKLPSVEVS